MDRKKIAWTIMAIVSVLAFLIYYGNSRFETRANEFTDSLNVERNIAISELSKQTVLPLDTSTSQFSIITDISVLPNFAQKSLIQNGDYMLAFPDSNKIYIYRSSTKKLITTILLQ